jgi:hypothetical protein
VSEDTPIPAPGEHPSLALGQLLAEAAPGAGCSVLDLGPASDVTVHFLADLGCRVRFAALFEALSSHGALPGTGSLRFETLCEQVLKLAPDERLDLIFAWDLFNYLTPGEISRLAGVLAPACHPGTRLLCLISIRPSIPAVPFSFTILDAGRLLYESAEPGLRPAPRYPEPTLARALRGFRPERAYLLRNGMQEYVFTHRAPDGAEARAPGFEPQRSR